LLAAWAGGRTRAVRSPCGVSAAPDETARDQGHQTGGPPRSSVVSLSCAWPA